MPATKSLSGHGRGQREYWDQLRWLDIWLFPHQPVLEFYERYPLSFDSPEALLSKRFLEKVSINLVTSCHVWTAGLDKAGYGQFHYDGNSKLAHGYSYTRMVGPVQSGKQLDHKACQLHYCVNWEHLEQVTIHENTLRAFEDQVALALRSSFQSPLWRPDQLPAARSSD